MSAVSYTNSDTQAVLDHDALAYLTADEKFDSLDIIQEEDRKQSNPWQSARLVRIIGANARSQQECTSGNWFGLYA